MISFPPPQFSSFFLSTFPLKIIVKYTPLRNIIFPFFEGGGRGQQRGREERREEKGGGVAEREERREGEGSGRVGEGDGRWVEQGRAGRKG